MEKKVLVNTMETKVAPVINDVKIDTVSTVADEAIDIMPIENGFEEPIADGSNMQLDNMGDFEEQSSFTISNGLIIGIVIGVCVIAGVVLGIICGKRAARK